MNEKPREKHKTHLHRWDLKGFYKELTSKRSLSPNPVALGSCKARCFCCAIYKLTETRLLLLQLELHPFEKDGPASFCEVIHHTEKVGHLEIGEKYLDQLCKLIGNVTLDKSSSKTWDWEIKRGNEKVKVINFLKLQDDWLTLMKQTIDELNQVEDQGSLA